MSLPVIVNSFAEQDVEEIYDWYNSQRGGLTHTHAVGIAPDCVVRTAETMPPGLWNVS